MNCCQCQGIEEFFGGKVAAKDLQHYRKKGPWKTTTILIKALKKEGIEGATLLDIGGGVGAVQHELLKVGVISATSVDAASAYLEAAREEAQRQGLADRVTYRHGNFVDLAPDVAPADIVTLDRAVCCYHDMKGLVGLSAARARKLYGLVYPRDTWWVKTGFAILNLVMWAMRRRFRVFVHPTHAVESEAHRQGLARRLHRKAGLWQVVVFAR